MLSDAKKTALWRVVVWARYCWPLLAGAVYTLVACLYSVKAVQSGVRFRVAPVRVILNTFKAARAYFTGETTESARNAFFGLLAGGSAAAVLSWLIALFLTAFAVVCAVRVFYGEQKTGVEAAGTRLYFRVAFRNRVALTVAQCLWIVPALYMQYFSFVGRRFLRIADEPPLYIKFDAPLTVALAGAAVTVALAILSARAERRLSLNLFRALHPQKEESEEEDENAGDAF